MGFTIEGIQKLPDKLASLFKQNVGRDSDVFR